MQEARPNPATNKIIYCKSKNFFNAFSAEDISLGEMLPNFLRTNFCSIVEIAGLIADGFNRPATCQSFIKHPPIPIVLSVWLVIAIMTISKRHRYRGWN